MWKNVRICALHLGGGYVMIGSRKMSKKCSAA